MAGGWSGFTAAPVALQRRGWSAAFATASKSKDGQRYVAARGYLMDLNLHIHLHADEVLVRLLQHLTQGVLKVAHTLDDVVAELATVKTDVGAVAQKVSDLAAALQAAGQDPAKVEAVFTGLTEVATSLESIGAPAP